ncbi:MAG: glycine betaine/L-proline ABC transporter ATP-binding protein [Dongiaceae bacterium]
MSIAHPTHRPSRPLLVEGGGGQPHATLTPGVSAEDRVAAIHEVPPIECEKLWKVYGHPSPELTADLMAGRLSPREAHASHGCVVAVADVSFRVGSGEIFCIMGLSGSGKSTLVRHINRLIQPTAGRVRLFGKELNGLNDFELRHLRSHQIGMVFQNVALLPHKTVIENVAYGLEVRGLRRGERQAIAREKLEIVGLLEWQRRYVDELSGGMQQRVGLARALAIDPDILLMDEPFSALDPLIRRQLQAEFAKLSQKMRKTTLFITHDLEEAVRLGDRIAIMKDGAFVQVGTPEEVVLHPANDYVAEFVKDISPLQILTATHVMRPIAVAHGGVALRKLPHDTILQEVINALADTPEPVAITDGIGAVIGTVSRDDIVLALRSGGG